MKQCSLCKGEFPATNEYFYKNGDRLRSACKACENERSKRYKSRNKTSIPDIELLSRQLTGKKNNIEFIMLCTELSHIGLSEYKELKIIYNDKNN
jgi:hypothetical protein